jgi:NTE family protein
MKVTDFTENKEVQKIISGLQKDHPKKIYSDVLDKEGNQYVDLVQEGGGVLGVALLGYTYVLEKMGVRFFSLAGTSAGAINTLLMASAGTVDKPKTEKIIEALANKNLYDFVDGPFFVKFLIKAVRTSKEEESLFLKVVKKILTVLWTVLWIIPVIVYLFIKKGMNPGKNFRNWMKEVLAEDKIGSYSDLNKIRQTPDDISIRAGVDNTTQGLEPKLKIIAAEITTESRVIFPDMDKLFWKDYGKVNPADYVRASMSIPLFFRPFAIKVENKNSKDWQDIVKFDGTPPERSLFVDGGIMSNFPIDVFHNPYIIPRLPTFGVKLGDDRDKTNNVKPLMKFLMAIFNSARHVLDYQFLLKNRDFEKLIQKIDTGEHNWLNFSMSDEAKIDLFCRGAKAADEFLRKFDWEGYKQIRAELIHK